MKAVANNELIHLNFIHVISKYLLSRLNRLYNAAACCHTALQSTSSTNDIVTYNFKVM